MGGFRKAVCGGLFGLTAVVLAVEVDLDRTPHSLEQERTDQTGTAPQPSKIRLELPIRLIEQAWTIDQIRRIDPGRADALEKPVSQVRLLDRDNLVANWRDGRVQYVVKGVKPWGASVGGQISTSTAKVTLTWSFSD